jgi:hypothetical protein
MQASGFLRQGFPASIERAPGKQSQTHFPQPIQVERNWIMIKTSKGVFYFYYISCVKANKMGALQNFFLQRALIAVSSFFVPAAAGRLLGEGAVSA